MKKIKIALVFGGKSTEHEVSLVSAKNIYDALDKKRYDMLLIYISKTGDFFKVTDFNLSNKEKIAFINKKSFFNLKKNEIEKSAEVFFPIIHGVYGEDGTLQGFLKMFNIPFVGAGVLGSAVGMDKDIMKKLLKEAGLPIGNFLTIESDQNIPSFKEVAKKLKLPFFVKPANTGSSVGISKVRNLSEYEEAIHNAFQFDRKIILEEFIKGREIECSILGNEKPQASIPGEVVTKRDFYSYSAKYLDKNGAVLKIPADIPQDIQKKIQKMAVAVFKVLNCEGMGRVDFFLKENYDIIVNEINTIPGFTNISMYPKLWEKSGLNYSRLIDRLIRLALERFAREKNIKTSL